LLSTAIAAIPTTPSRRLIAHRCTLSTSNCRLGRPERSVNGEPTNHEHIEAVKAAALGDRSKEAVAPKLWR
jgi:hypothetical protein